LAEFKELSVELDYTISVTKLQLLRALDALKRNYASLKELNEKKRKAIKKSYIREFIRNLKIQLCITSPQTLKSLGTPQIKSKDSKDKKSGVSDQIEVTIRDEKGCIHERFAIIRELAASKSYELT
jgi:hypothetical protein